MSSYGSEVLVCMRDPSRYKGQLPCNSAAPLITKDITVYAVVKPGTDVQTTGYLIWNVLRGAYSLGLFGTISSGTINAPDVFNPAGVASANLQWPIPYQRQLSIKPPLTDTISLGRLGVGKISLYSATTSTTLAALNGELACSAVTDLRNCGDFSVPSIMQAAMTTKDAFGNEKVSHGISAIVGPDVHSKIKPINANRAITVGDYGIISLGSTIPAYNAPTITTVLASYNPFGFTPRVPEPMSATTEVIPSGIDFQVVLNCELYSGLPFFAAKFVAEVWTGVVDENGVLITTGRNYDLGSRTGDNANHDNMTFSTGIIRGAFEEQVMAVNILAWFNDGASPIPLSAVTINYVTSEIRLVDAYGDNGMGSYRVFRWDNVDSSQTINVKGTLQIDGMPNGSLAPFLKSAKDSGFAAGASNVISTLRYLFASKESSLRRTYPTVREAEYFSSLDGADVINRAYAAGMYASGMYAGGFFDEVGDFLGHAIGKGLGTLGDTVAGAIGLADGGTGKKRPRTSTDDYVRNEARRINI